MAVRRVSDGGVLRLLRTRALSRLARFDRVLGEVRFAFELVAPTSVVVQGTGSSASVVGAGSVDFASATSLSLNGVFSAEYDNYMISLRHVVVGSTAPALWLRLRQSGTDATTNYTWQVLQAVSTTVSGSRNSVEGYARVTNTASAQRSGTTVYMYGPHLAQPTALRGVSAGGLDDASIYDYASTHSTSSAYDGFTLIPAAGSITGNIAVYGLRG